MLWTIASSFPESGARWIDDHAPPSEFAFRKVGLDEPADDWHRRTRRSTPFTGWMRYWRHVSAAAAVGDGQITIFPQLALMAGARRRLLRDRRPLVAWCFNTGRFPRDLRRTGARAAMRGTERIVVHSRAEVALVSDFLDLPTGVVQFVPLQCAPIPIVEREETRLPFAIAMGSADRDYATLAEAARRTRIPVTIVASPRSLHGIDLPDNVTALSGLSHEQCRHLVQRARFSIVPLSNAGGATGQVTVLESMRMQRAVVATRTIGTVDYVSEGRTGLLVPPGNAAALAEHMLRLWEDDEARTALATNAARYADDQLSDEAAGEALVRILRGAAELNRERFG